MANKIKITTTELREQAGRMDALNDRLDGVIAQMNSALKKIDDSTCAKFSSNIILKTASLRRNMQNARNYLLIGAGIARKCAESYTNADIVIRKSDFICCRTLMIHADKAACDLDRDLINDLANYKDLDMEIILE